METVRVRSSHTARVNSSTGVTEYIVTNAGYGVAVSVTRATVANGQAAVAFAHSLHTLPKVIDALGTKVATSSGVSGILQGDILPATLGLGKVEAGERGHQISLRMLWAPYEVLRGTRVSDGDYSRSPTLRGQEARFVFGRGKWKHKWELTMSKFVKLPYVEVQAVVSKRRY